MVTVNVPPATKAKHVRCTIKDASIKVEVLTLPEDASVVVDGYLLVAAGRAGMLVCRQGRGRSLLAWLLLVLRREAFEYPIIHLSI